MELADDKITAMKNETTIFGPDAKKFSFTGAASLYVCSLLLGGLTLFGYFFLPHSGLLLTALAVSTVIVFGTSLYSIVLLVKAFRAHSKTSIRGAD